MTAAVSAIVTPSFAGHQTFALRAGWLKKGIDALQNPDVGGETVFTRPDALVTLGVGKNMVISIRWWLLATGAAEEVRDRGRTIGLRPSPLGLAIFGNRQAGTSGFDPYLEDPATLWLFHLILTAPVSFGNSAFSWAFAFNRLRDAEFSRDRLTRAVIEAVDGATRAPSQETVSRDVDCLLLTYSSSSHQNSDEDTLDRPFIALNLIRPTFERHYRFEIGPKTNLPPAIFAYALANYWRKIPASIRAIPVRDIVYGEGSPGLQCKLDEDSVYGYLDSLADLTGGVFRFEDSALTRQIVREERPGHPFNMLALLDTYYDE